jgi:hypothetical protein
MLDELEAHAWKAGEIVDTGRHNDLVMALAHAVDQFTGAEPNLPVVMGTMKKGGWATGGRRSGKVGRGGSLGGRALNRRL